MKLSPQENITILNSIKSIISIIFLAWLILPSPLIVGMYLHNSFRDSTISSKNNQVLGWISENGPENQLILSSINSRSFEIKIRDMNSNDIISYVNFINQANIQGLKIDEYANQKNITHFIDDSNLANSGLDLLRQSFSVVAYSYENYQVRILSENT